MLTRLLRILTLLLSPVMLWPALLHAQAEGPDTPEAGSVEEIARATTETRFLSPWVSYLPASATVVSPRAFLHRDQQRFIRRVFDQIFQQLGAHQNGAQHVI